MALCWGIVAGLPASAAERAPRARPASVAAPESEARVIVKYRADAALMRIQSAGMPWPQHAQTLAVRLGLSLSDGRPLGSHAQLVRGLGIGSAALAARLAALSDVEYAVVDERKRPLAAPNDPRYGPGQATTPVAGQWYLRTPDATLVSAINAEAAWALTTGSPNVVVAVLDTGVRPEHPDLAGKLLPGYDFVSEVSAANDGDGRDNDPSDPGDWITDAENASGEFANCGRSDSSWHGTQVSGLIGAATNNGAGMAGSGRNVMLLPVRVLGKCGGRTSDIVAAMRWAAGVSADPFVNPNPAKVLNLSLGSTNTCSQTYQDAINQITAAGVTVVVAAGNDTGHAVNQPGNCNGVITVAGIRHIGSKVGYSNIGPEVAIAAPAGNCVNISPGSACLYPLLTTVNSGLTGPAVNTFSDSFDYSVGTSFATPLVAGTAALMLSANPGLTPAQIKANLQASARAFPSTGSDPGTVSCQAPSSTDQLECYCTTTTCGAGMLDAQAAVNRVSASPPAVTVTSDQPLPVLGEVVSLAELNATAAPGRSIVSRQWRIISGASNATFSGAVNGATATLNSIASGKVFVSLTVTDSAGIPFSASSFVEVQPPTIARVSTASDAPQVDTSVLFDGSASTAALRRTLTSYRWEISSGASRASFVGATTGSTSTLKLGSAGDVTVRLTVTDSRGATSSVETTISVQALPSSGGGGALSGLWLAGLALAVLMLRRARRRV